MSELDLLDRGSWAGGGHRDWGITMDGVGQSMENQGLYASSMHHTRTW